MKRIVLTLTLSIFIMMTASAAEPTNPTASLNAKLDLTTQNYAKFYFANSADRTTPITTLSLDSNSDNTPSGIGSFCIVWDVISSSPFELRISSGAMTNSNKEELHWMLEKESETVFNKNNHYGGSGASNIIYTHHPNNGIGKEDFVQLNVITEDVSNLSNSEYSARLIVELKSN